ncbi:IcmT/TraK family protein [Neptuniibacter sp. QD37_11]|uniref:IcmT/TraK family protein n=1 Tax=Neptuniibacter sp. QD37_11 TaxID=3398209 RepID=UPI0039F5B3AF
MARRDIARPVKFFFLEAIAAVPFLLLLLHISWEMLYFLMGTVALLVVLGMKGLRLPMLARFLRRKLVGPRLAIRPPPKDQH